MKLLYFAPSSYGGLADYARCQLDALAKASVELDILCAPSFASDQELPGNRISRLPVPDTGPTPKSRAGRALRFMSVATRQYRLLADTIEAISARHVLISAYAEYFAPLWSGRLRKLKNSGVTFGAIVHDPIRDTVFGPVWWHQRSVADAYSILRHAYVHESVVLDTVKPVSRLRTTVIPHGTYEFKTETPAKAQARRELGLPADKPVLLAFGHIRDNKNLNLLLDALREHPEVHLVVAGSEQSAGQRPADYYRNLASRLSVSDRCHWHVRFIPEAETGRFFAAADFLALTYSGSFKSASGVLSASVRFRKPCIASSGDGPLRSAVCGYDLGIWVQPDNPAALSAGLKQLLAGRADPRWSDYERDNSWARNAKIIARTMFARDDE